VGDVLRGSICRLTTPEAARTFAVCAFAILVARWIDWYGLRCFLAGIVATMHRCLFASTALTHSGDRLDGDDLSVTITPACVYAQVLVCVPPLLWKKGPLLENLVRASVAIVLLEAANALRIVAAIRLSALGLSWFWAEKVGAYALGYAVPIGLILWWCVNRSPRERVIDSQMFDER
jgi:hypothetical protein